MFFFLMFSLVRLSVKLMVWSVMAGLWLMWAMLALPVALVASVSGNDRLARLWMRSLRWPRLL